MSTRPAGDTCGIVCTHGSFNQPIEFGNGPLRYRAAVPEDLGFVYDSLAQSFRKSWYAGPYPLPVLLNAIRGFADIVLARPTVETVVAVKADDPNYLVGWLAWEPAGHHNHNRAVCAFPALIWCHTKDIYRNGAVTGIPVASALMRHVGLEPRARFCYPLRPHGFAKEVLLEGDRRRGIAPKWSGDWKPETYKFPPLAG